MKEKLKTMLKTIHPFRRVIISLLLVGLFVSTIYAFQFEQEANAQNGDKLDPRTSSTAFEKVEIVKEKDNKKKDKSDKQSKEEQQTRTKTVTIKEPIKNKKLDRGKNQNQFKEIISQEAPDQAKLLITSGSAAGSYKIELEKGYSLTGLELMIKTREEYGLNFSHSGSGAMAFVNSIGNLANKVVDEPGCQWAGNAWMLYYNGKQSLVGIGSIDINNQDNITWNYEHYCY